jgi:hypothetical protein
MSFDAVKRRKSLNSGAKACEQRGEDGSSFAQATKHPAAARLVARFLRTARLRLIWIAGADMPVVEAMRFPRFSLIGSCPRHLD